MGRALPFRAPGPWPWVAVAVPVAAGSAYAAWLHAHGANRAPETRIELRAPRVTHPIPIDAELDGKKVWESEAGGTGVFTDAAGKGMVPYTQAKVRWGQGKLYFLLYAGDLDLEGNVTERDGAVSRDDSFQLELGGPHGRSYSIDVSVLGTLADAECSGASPSSRRTCDARWQSGATVAVDRDGTLNRIGDNDEEWVVEMAVPLESIGWADAHVGSRIPFAIRRCEIGHGGVVRSCGGFGTAGAADIVLDSASVEGDRVATVGAGPQP
jgi:hypothetical protein